MKWKRDWNPSVSVMQSTDTHITAFFLFCSLQAVGIIMKIGIMILCFLQEKKKSDIWDGYYFLSWL